MVTVYDMASGVLHRAKTDLSDNVTNNGSQDHSCVTGPLEMAHHPKEQLALQLQTYPEATQNTAEKIPAELAYIGAEQFLSKMEK